MEISSDQALEALGQVARTQHRLGVLRGYRHAAPYFFLWGCIWAVGFALTYLFPGRSNTLWMVLDLVGFGASALIARAQARQRAESRSGWQGAVRLVAMAATFVGFLVATYAVLQPQSLAQFAVFPVLVIAAIYIGVGIWRGLRWWVAGLALAVLVLGAYFLQRPYLLLWLAGAGGGVLLLSGAWLRRG